jgi:chromosome segregation ATPase
MVSRGHVESLESDLSKAEDKLNQLVALNEKLKDELENAKMERDSAQRGLDNFKNEKNILESQRKTLAADLESTLKLKNNMAAGLSKVTYQYYVRKNSLVLQPKNTYF